MSVGIIGLGYVGLPLALLIASKGLEVVGFDKSEKKVGMLRDGVSYVDDVTEADLTRAILGEFTPTFDPKKLRDCSVFVICVPTPLDSFGEPDLTAVIGAAHDVSQFLKIGDLVILESTTYPGTTRDIVLPILELSELKAGRDFYLSYSPERVNPRDSNYNLENTPKLVAGLTETCLVQSEAFYGQFISTTVLVSTLEEAEMAKLVENAYRFINISFVNELSLHCAKIGVNVWNVINAAATKPYGFQRFEPGPGVGGHCIPVDPIYLSHYVQRETGESFHLIAAARKVNQEMPGKIFERITKCIADADPRNNINKVLLVGVGYKAGVNDTRESPATELASMLTGAGFIVEFYDSFVSQFIVDGRVLDKVASLGEDSLNYVVVVLQKVENLRAVIGENFDSRLVVDLKNN